jgi:GT2 family glycosyltransferase
MTEKLSNKIENPKVSIISVNYDEPEMTCQLLASIDKLKLTDIEIIIVDNGSPTKSPDIIKTKYPYVNLIISKENLGFAGGNNLGIKEAKGEYLFFVNNDVIINDQTIKNLLLTFNDHNKIGLASPKQYQYGKDKVLEYAGATNINYVTGRNKTIGHNQVDKGQFNLPKETFYCHGAAMMVPKKIIKDIGMIPEKYFLYYEEIEWCEIIRNKGYKIYYQPNAYIHHKVSGTVGQDSLLKTYYLARNRILFMRRNKSIFPFILFFMIISFPSRIFSYVFSNKFKHLKYYLLGVLWNFGLKTNPKF